MSSTDTALCTLVGSFYVCSLSSLLQYEGVSYLGYKHRMVCGRMQGSLIEESWLILGNLSFIDQVGALDVSTRLRA